MAAFVVYNYILQFHDWFSIFMTKYSLVILVLSNFSIFLLIRIEKQPNIVNNFEMMQMLKIKSHTSVNLEIK